MEKPLKPKFRAGDIVEHIESCIRYRIIFDAWRGRIRLPGGWRQAYVYRVECDHAGTIYTREQADFEAKFKEVPWA